MKTRDTIILLAVVVVVGLVIFIWERNLPSTGDIEQREGTVLTRFDRDEVTRISMTRGGVETVLEKDGEDGSWAITSPVEAEAEAAVVDGLLADLEYMSSERKVEKATGEQRKSFGLVEPSLQVKVTQGKQVIAFVLGSESEAGGIYLALDGDDDVHVVDTMMIQGLLKSPGEFRKKRILDREGGPVTRIVSRPKGDKPVHISLTDGHWSVSPDGQTWERASQRAVDKVVATLEGLQALEYIEDGVDEKELGSRGFPLSASRVEFERADGTGGSLVFGGPCGPSPTGEVGAGGMEDPGARVRAWLPGEGTLVCVGLASRDTILTPLDDLRLLAPAEIDTYEIYHLEARRGGEITVRLEKDEVGQWSVTAPGEPRLAETQAVEGLFEALNESRSETLEPVPVDLASVGLDEESAVTLVLLDVLGEQAAALELGVDGEGRVTFLREGEDMYGTLEATDTLLGAGDAWNYLRRTVVRRDYFDALELSVTGRTEHRLVKDEGRWSFVPPVEPAVADPEAEGPLDALPDPDPESEETFSFQPDAADVRDTVESFSALQVDRFLSSASPVLLDRHGLTRPEWTVSVTYAEATGAGDEGRVTVTLLVGSEVEGGRAAYLDGSDLGAIFVLADDVVWRLTRPLADRGVFAAAVQDAVEVTFSRAGQSVTLPVKGLAPETADMPPDAFMKADDAKDLFGSLVKLRADTVVSYGPPPSGTGFGNPLLIVRIKLSDDTASTITLADRFVLRGEDLVHARVSGTDATYGIDASLVGFIE